MTVVTDRWAGAPTLATDEDGMRLIQVSTKEHLTALGQDQSNCAYAHAFWSDGLRTEPLEYFFVYVDKDGKARATFHCKATEWLGKVHPLDDTQEVKEATAFYGGYVYSTRYETEYSTDPAKSKSDAETRVKSAQKELGINKGMYDKCKAEAVQFMALGRDNPFKPQLDAYNRKVSTCKEQVRDAEFAASLYEGIRFNHLGVELCLLAYVTRGSFKDPITRNRYTEGFAEFLKGRVV